jgi:hypothetical protein
MEFIKKLFSAIALSLILSLPLSMLEALSIYSIINLYEIPYLIKFQYYQILGISFIIMITRNRIRIESENEKDEEKDLISSLASLSVNRLFKIVFVWSVSFAVHYIFFNS